ncbi:hypothetical protein [Chachezhania antarctica]|uniref:hypothetical protein n=1 Tax=Chachezhania antarctica TaxID=2340860 RepID=UPI000EB2152A|nr:hypothetical protein [Chachezhania antarctica]
MSNTDSFIDEVTEEVRRDRMFALMRRYGWIAVAAVLLIVGGAGYNEYRKASLRSSAEALGDAVLAAMAEDRADARAGALDTVAQQFAADDPDGATVVRLLAAGTEAEAGEPAAAVSGYEAVAASDALPEVYRQIARFKALTLSDSGIGTDDKRTGFEALATPGSAVRLLAEEQLALLDIQAGEQQAAIDRLQTILMDSQVSERLQQRVSQVIVALGGTPNSVPGAPG